MVAAANDQGHVDLRSNESHRNSGGTVLRKVRMLELTAVSTPFAPTRDVQPAQGAGAHSSKTTLHSMRTNVETCAYAWPVLRRLFWILGVIFFYPSMTTAATVEESDAMALAASKRGDFSTVLRIVRPLAEGGHAKSQQRLGYLYETGSGVPKDNFEAMKWYKLAAAQALPAAQYSVGNMYESSSGVPRNYPEALKWYMLAAK